MVDYKPATQHRMTRRSYANDYTQPGMYHITLRVDEGMGRPFGRVVGDASLPDGSSGAPRMELSVVGAMVEHELLHSIAIHYPMVEIQDYVVMPEHVHFIVEVHEPIVSRNGKAQHLGQVIAGFKKGCNRRFWVLTGQGDDGIAALGSGGNGGGNNCGGNWQGKPASTDGGGQAATSGAALSARSCPAVFPQGASASSPGDDASSPSVPFKVPSRQRSGRRPLFGAGYVDVMPLESGQLEQQRRYISANPRSRLLRSTYGQLLRPQRGGIDTALTVTALMGYLQRECGTLSDDSRQQLLRQLLTDGPHVACDSYGDRRLLGRRLLPVVCHRRDASRFAQQKSRCLQAARQGAVLVSARIAKGEQDIIDSAVAQGFPVVLVSADGMEPLYHPSADRTDRCLAGRLLIITPWRYHYRSADATVSVVECKTMNCVVQAVCRLRDDWWAKAQ